MSPLRSGRDEVVRLHQVVIRVSIQDAKLFRGVEEVEKLVLTDILQLPRLCIVKQYSIFTV